MTEDDLVAKANASAAAGDLHGAATAMYEAAVLAHKDGRDPRKHQDASARYRLKNLLASPRSVLPAFQISAIGDGDTCPACRALDGTIVPRGIALKRMPVPVRGCRGYLKSGKVALCRCSLDGLTIGAVQDALKIDVEID